MAAEESLYDRLSFVRFVGLSLGHDEVPDSSTICRFRQSLLEKNVLKRLLDKLNHQLERRGVLVREGALVAASVVSSSRRPSKATDIFPENREADDAEASEVTVSYSDDADAAWLRKGNRTRYGYKIHTATVSREGFLLGGHVTPANRSDTQEFIELLDEIGPMAGGCVYADKGYSSVRAKVERAFGTRKWGYGFFRTRYLGMPKVELEFLLNAMALNLKKAVLSAGCQGQLRLKGGGRRLQAKNPL